MISYHKLVVKKYLQWALVSLIFVFGSSLLWAKYKIRDIQVKPAEQYSAHQAFQNIVIAAHPCETQAKTLELFDTDKLRKKGILPVLVVVENNNDFAIRIHERDIFFVDQDGTNLPSIPYPEVLLHITLKKSLSDYSTRPELLVRQVVDRKMIMDFEHKAFGEKLVAPGSSDYGVLFFWLPEEGDLAGRRLYIPEILDVTNGAQLMFFEFEVGTTGK
ncbi:hypothetical protein MYX78_13330 [Acidobacteria bacterium AH-259-G07]|nr:hypothetical protein [Acidobacteria bacterium AH-259-G07]